MNSNTRRGWRTFANVFTGLGLLGLLAFVVHRLEGQADWLGWIALAIIGLLAVDRLFYGGENVAARLTTEVTRDGVKAGFDNRKDSDNAVAGD